jgi:hypothetical protein
MLELAWAERVDGHDPGPMLQPSEGGFKHADRVPDDGTGALCGSVLVALREACLQVGVAVEQRTVGIERRLAALPELATDVLAASLDVATVLRA